MIDFDLLFLYGSKIFAARANIAPHHDEFWWKGASVLLLLSFWPLWYYYYDSVVHSSSLEKRILPNIFRFFISLFLSINSFLRFQFEIFLRRSFCRWAAYTGLLKNFSNWIPWITFERCTSFSWTVSHMFRVPYTYNKLCSFKGTKLNRN